MEYFNFYGLIIMLIILIPNIIFGITHKEEFENKYDNKTVEIAEQIGRFGSFALMIVNIPIATLDYHLNNAELIYIIVNGVLCLTYCLMWIIYWNKNNVAKALALSITPSVIFLFSAIITLNIPLFITAVIFSFSHILISYKNAVIK